MFVKGKWLVSDKATRLYLSQKWMAHKWKHLSLMSCFARCWNTKSKGQISFEILRRTCQRMFWKEILKMHGNTHHQFRAWRVFIIRTSETAQLIRTELNWQAPFLRNKKSIIMFCHKHLFDYSFRIIALQIFKTKQKQKNNRRIFCDFWSITIESFYVYSDN